MDLKSLKILDDAEKMIKERARANLTIGTILEDARLELVEEETRAEYKRLICDAKKRAPELWTCPAGEYPKIEGDYSADDFFGLLEFAFSIYDLALLVDTYPKEKGRLKKMFGELWGGEGGHASKIDTLYWHLHWYLECHDYAPTFKELYDEVAEIYDPETREKKRSAERESDARNFGAENRGAEN